MSADAEYMARALALAERGLYGTDPNPRVGAVLVRDGRIVGEGYHAQAGTPHAEVHALRAAGEAAHGATCYVTLEPCSHFGRTPPCADALVAAGVARVVVAMQDPNPQVAGQGIARLRSAGIAVEVGLLAEQAAALNPGFISRMQRGRPWVRLKLAASLDGRTALGNGVSQWITGPAARADVQRLRARSAAILTGIGTVLADDPRLDPRLEGETVLRQPLRVVLDRELRTPPAARLFTAAGPVLILHGSEAPAARQAALRAAGAQLQAVAPAAHGLALEAVWQVLQAREINEVLAECGPTLAGALIEGGWVDELVLYLAPKLLGHDGLPLAHLGPYTTLDQVSLWQCLRHELLGEDLKLLLRPRS
ncbi:MAG: bifunctional diaminohydroxyphosphoribosylaminopyrimidine deaminase/5-amino-6-(5-phosphoribosylamino)uracil reductase RibD [Pseudomonadota bacterium]